MTVFANVLNIRLTQAELVLEFGSFFPDRPNMGPPSDYKPEIRVVLNKAVLAGLLQGLQQASAHDGNTPQATAVSSEQPKKTVGFAG